LNNFVAVRGAIGDKESGVLLNGDLNTDSLVGGFLGAFGEIRFSSLKNTAGVIFRLLASESSGIW